MHYLGYGDPRSARVWFVGLEEPQALCTPTALMQRRSRSYQVRNGCKGAKTAVYIVISKIITGLHAQSSPAKWREYHDYQLFSAGSAVFQTNLYPLGKRSEIHWPTNYQRWFRMSRNEYYALFRNTACERFAFLRSKRAYYGNPLTICFGKGNWKQFARCFTDVDEEFSDEGAFRCYRRSRIIMTEFFRHTRMPDRSVRELILLISREGWNPFRT